MKALGDGAWEVRVETHGFTRGLLNERETTPQFLMKLSIFTSSRCILDFKYCLISRYIRCRMSEFHRS